MIRKLLLSILLAFGLSSVFTVSAQSPSAAETSSEQQQYTFFIEIEGYQSSLSNTVSSVKLRIGTSLKSMLQLSTAEFQKISDRTFPTMLDAANVLGSQGWTFAGTYTTQYRNANTIHWIMTRTVAHPNDLLTGLL